MFWSHRRQRAGLGGVWVREVSRQNGTPPSSQAPEHGGEGGARARGTEMENGAMREAESGLLAEAGWAGFPLHLGPVVTNPMGGHWAS